MNSNGRLRVAQADCLTERYDICCVRSGIGATAWRSANSWRTRCRLTSIFARETPSHVGRRLSDRGRRTHPLTTPKSASCAMPFFVV